MKILMVVRPNLYESPGGDTTQINMTAKYLKEIGIEIDILFSSDKLIETYDIIHFFNIIRPDDIFPFIASNSHPYVVSTIFVDYYSYERRNRKGLAGFLFKFFSSGQMEYLKALARWVKNGDKIKSFFYLLHGHKASIIHILKKSSIILPNSESEYNRLCEYTGLRPNHKKVVNAIDGTIFYNNVVENCLYKNHILCVGRIEGRKNQLNLIKALLNTNVQLTIVGKPSTNHLSYYIECKKLAKTGNNVHFVDQVTAQELAGIYKAAKVHVLPSWFETTGLSSLEAGAMGCNIVVTKFGDTEEYFKDMAYYCNPDDIDSIRNAVLKAYNDDVNENLKNYILNNYTWDKTALQTLEAYKEVMANKK